MTKVKICGLANLKDAIAAKNSGADFLGFVIEVPTAIRSLSLQEAKEIFNSLKGKIPLVALTALTKASEIEKLCSFLKADAVQLLKPVQPKELAKLRKQNSNIAIFKSIPVMDETALEEAKIFQGLADFLVLDSFSGKQLGGTGKQADFAICKRIVKESKTPIFLAGGLNPENVVAAIKTVKPFGVDVSSGVKMENNKRKLDLNKLRKFIERAKQ